MFNFLRGRVRWILIGWMFAISAIAYLDRVNISIAGHSIEEEFHLNNLQLGWVFSAFVLGYALFQAPGGRLADRFGPRRILALGTVWWAVFTSLTAFVPGGVSHALLVLLLVRFGLGIGEAVVYPASNRLVATWIPSQKRGIANGLIFAGVGAGAGVTPPLITYILLHHGWRRSFWISALIGLLAGGVWFVLARDAPEQHPWVAPEEIAHIEDGLPGAALEGARPLPWPILCQLYGRHRCRQRTFGGINLPANPLEKDLKDWNDAAAFFDKIPTVTMDGQIYSRKDFAERYRARARERIELLSKVKGELGGS